MLLYTGAGKPYLGRGSQTRRSTEKNSGSTETKSKPKSTPRTTPALSPAVTAECQIFLYENLRTVEAFISRWVGGSLGSGRTAAVFATKTRVCRIERNLRSFGLDLNLLKKRSRFRSSTADGLLDQVLQAGRTDQRLFAEYIGDPVRKIHRAGQDTPLYEDLVERLLSRGLVDAAIELNEMTVELCRSLQLKRVLYLPAKLNQTPAFIRFVEHLNSKEFLDMTETVILPSVKNEIDLLARKEEKRRQLAAIVDSSGDAIIGVDLEGRITSWNYGADVVFGYRESEMLGRPVSLLHPVRVSHEEAGFDGSLDRDIQMKRFEALRRRKDGTDIDVSWTVSPILDERGRVIGTSKIGRDISKQKRNEADLVAAHNKLLKLRDDLESRSQERADSLKEAISQMEEFSYTVSHDLRAPLRAMNFHSGLLMEDYRHLLSSEPEAIESVERIAAACVRMDRMTRDVLTYSRVARDELLWENISLDVLLEGTISHYSALQPPNAKVRFTDLGDIRGHVSSVVQIVSNLLTNSAKFIAPGVVPDILVRTERRGTGLRLWVEDNGIGIDPDYKHRLFGMFERLHPSLGYEGTGIGLAIVRKAAERMGGRVGVESDGKSGSKFWVDFKYPL